MDSGWKTLLSVLRKGTCARHSGGEFGIDQPAPNTQCVGG